MKKNDKNAYTIILVVIIVGFMIFLTTGTLRLILNETRDNEAIGNYSKSYIGAESAQEIGLLDIKEKGYGYNEGMSESNILGNNTQSAKISYTNDGKVKVYSGILESLSYNIIPLFFINSDGTENKTEDYRLELLSGNQESFSWNIIGKNSGISGTGDDMLKGAEKSLYKINPIETNLKYDGGVNIQDFLSSSDTNYLVLFNSSNNDIEYKIDSSFYFTKPKLNIVSTAWVSYFKQNIKTEINYADIVNRAKYSIYSGN